MPNILPQWYISDEISNFFNSTIGVKVGYSLSWNLFVLHIDELELFQWFVKEDDIEKLSSKMWSSCFCCTHDRVFFASSLGGSRNFPRTSLLKPILLSSFNLFVGISFLSNICCLVTRGTSPCTNLPKIYP